MSIRTIYDALRAANMTQEGALAVMGNMMAESGMKANIAQRGMTKLSDEQYTAAADNGLIDFTRDSVGYGLCQWTFSPRKAALLAFTKNRGVSVGDEDTQVQFCIRELQSDFPMIFWALCTSHDLYDLTAKVCEKYENPAVKNTDDRYRFAQQLISKLFGSEAMAQEAKSKEPQNASAPATATEPDFYNLDVLEIQAVMTRNGYWSRPDGYKSAEFFAALQEFVNDMQKC